MLNLNTAETELLAQKHYDGVKYYLNQVIDYYINIFDILLGKRQVKETIKILYKDSKLHEKTINTLGGRLCYKKCKYDKIKKGKIEAVLTSPDKYFNPLFLKNASDFSLFFKDLKSKLKEIIISKPKKLILIESILKINYPFIKQVDGSLNEPIRNLLLLGIFNYNKFSDKKGFPIDNSGEIFWERYNFAEALNVNTCAYCNRIYTYTVLSSEGLGIISPSLDHFFDKARHPLFALSFYNLIPSCTNCNTLLKGRNEFNLTDFVHPYLSGFEDHATFTYKPKDTEATLGESKNLEVYLSISNSSSLIHQVENSIKLFQLNKIYGQHADYVQELIKKKIMSNSRYLEILRYETYKDLNLSLEDSYRLAYGNHFLEKDFHKRPLAKLTKDLVRELKMI